MISMTRQANQAGQILLVTLTIGTGIEWKGVLHKEPPAGLELFILLMHMVLCLVDTRKLQKIKTKAEQGHFNNVEKRPRGCCSQHCQQVVIPGRDLLK